MSRFAPAASLLILALIAAPSFAAPPEKGPRPENGARPQKPGGRPQGRPGMNPEQMVARLMQQFDKDGDQKLDKKELTALLTFMRQQRGRMRPGGPAPGGRPGNPGPGGRPQRPGGDKPARPGGQAPKRPAAE